MPAGAMTSWKTDCTELTWALPTTQFLFVPVIVLALKTRYFRTR